jgi:hypothetical protein
LLGRIIARRKELLRLRRLRPKQPILSRRTAILRTSLSIAELKLFAKAAESRWSTLVGFSRLLPPRPRIACRLRAHPTGLALLIAEQAFQEQTDIPRNTLLFEQRTYPLLDLPKRRCP